MYKFTKISKQQKGFILLFSLLISSVILTAGLAVSRIIIRQIYLASVQRDSQMALFAADTGLECGRYWYEGGVGTPQCNGKNLVYLDDMGVQVASLTGGVVDFWFNIGEPGSDNTCVQVIVDNNDPRGSASITAKGYNVGCVAGNPTGGRVVERELVYIYQ